MARLLILALLLVLVGCGGTVGLIWFGVIPDFTGLIVPMHSAEEAQRSSPPPPRREDPVFVSIEPLLISVIGEDGVVEHAVYVACRLLAVPGHRQELRSLAPRLRDVLRLKLLDALPKHLAKRPTVDLKALKVSLRKAAVAAVGEHKIKDVLIESVFEQ